MSNKSKGAAFELRIKKYLESLGYTVDKARASIKFLGPGRFFSTSNDFFNCADLIAVHPDRQFTLFIQATASKTSQNVASRQNKMEAIPWNFGAQRVMVWQRHPRERGVVRVREMVEAVSDYQWHKYEFALKDGQRPPEDFI